MRYFLNFLVTLLFLSSPVFAQEKPVGNELKISLKTNKGVYRIGDPFIIYGIIENTSDKPFYYNPGLSSSDFSPVSIIFDKNKKQQRRFISGSSQAIRMGVLPSAELLIGPKGTYKFSVHGSVEKGNVVLSQDKGGENAVKAFGIAIDLHRMGTGGFLLDGAGRYFMKVSCALGTNNNERYISTTDFMSDEVKFEVRDEESNSPVNVQNEIKNAIQEEDYTGGLQDILYDFSREGRVVEKIKNENPGLYKQKYAQLVDKYLELISGYSNEVRQKLLQRKDDPSSALRSFLMQERATKRLIVMGFITVDPEPAKQKQMEVIRNDIANTARSMAEEYENKLKKKYQEIP